MAAASQPQAYRSCVTGRCTLNVRRLTDGRDGTVYYLCGGAQTREAPASPCRVYQLDSRRGVPAPPPPSGSRGLKKLLSHLPRK